MPLSYDLHAHSTASDGTLTPTELVQRARSRGVDVLALTDHDNSDGVTEAQAAAATVGLILIPGVELSVTWRHQVIHVLGLGIDTTFAPLQAGFTRLKAFRGWRAEEIGRRLEKAGIPGAYEGACRFASGQIVGRTHFARFLVDSGHARDMRDVFKRFLVRNKPGHVGGQWAELEETLGWIHGAGGQAVIAHPARYNLTATKLRGLIGEFKECGGEGLEVVSGSQSPQENSNMGVHARREGLLASCGSDYHGPENPWVELGRLAKLPKGCEPVWQHWGYDVEQEDGAMAVRRVSGQ